jgi:hypothetical protein
MSPQHVSYQACRWSVSTRSGQYTQLRRRNDDISDAESPGAFLNVRIAVKSLDLYGLQRKALLAELVGHFACLAWVCPKIPQRSCADASRKATRRKENR